MKLINVEKLKDDIAVLLERNEKLIDPWLAYCIDDIIEEQAVIEAEPVRHGRWVKRGNQYICSACGETDYYAYEWNSDTGEYTMQDLYCPSCGARMEEQG